MGDEISSNGVNQRNQGPTTDYNWVVEINEKLNIMENTSETQPLVKKNIGIYKLQENVREQSADSNFVYTPRIVSFGPYHHKDESCKKTNEIKELVLLHCLSNSDKRINDYVGALSEDIQNLKEAYSELDQKWEEEAAFLQFMIYDVCFFLQVLQEGNHPGSHQLLATFGISLNTLMEYYRHDILLLENQIPLQLLIKLLALQKNLSNEEATQKVYKLLLKFVAPSFLNVPENMGEGTYLHALDFYRHTLLHYYHADTKRNIFLQIFMKYSVVFKRVCTSNGVWNLFKFLIIIPVFLILLYIGVIAFQVVLIAVFIVICPLLALRYYMYLLKPDISDIYLLIPSATELDKVGIGFCKTNTKSLEDIAFRHEVLRLPQIHVDCTTQSRFLNLMAFEQLHPDAENVVTSYIYFLSRILQSDEDVRLLQIRDIIRSTAHKVEIVELFKVLTKDINMHDPHLLLIKQYQYVGKHLTDIFSYRMNNVWERDLSQVYLRSPWTLISVVAALFLFSLTSVQTVYTVMGYHNPK